jgi:Tol biopolymer transport system component
LWRSEEGKAVEVWRGQENRILEPPAISPDGRRIAIVINQAGKRRLQLITADGAESSSVAQAIEIEGSTDWSPDGHWIITGGNDGKGEGLFKIPVAGGAPVRLTNTVGRNPVWSPDGSIIVYSGPNTFALTPSDGTTLKMPDIRTQREGERVRFMPDGRSLVYMQGTEATPWQDF